MMFQNFDKGIIFRFLLSIVLAAAALGLFLMSRAKITQPVTKSEKDFASLTLQLDRDVDTVLSHFNIQKEWTKKLQFPVPNSSLNRIERRVLIPPDILPIQMNLVLNRMAKRYNGRAVASENLKESTVTIHIEVDGTILETIVLKTDAKLKQTPKEKQPRV